MTDYPMGDGHPKCPECKGRGVIDYTPPGKVIPGVKSCRCVQIRDIQANMERGWRGLSRFHSVKKTPLGDYLDRSIRITASETTLRSHLRRVALAQGAHWRFNVFSDADLMDAWLSRVDVEDIYDPDVEAIRRTAVSGRFAALVDLVEPPGLLILRLGVKAARNSAMPEVLLEALHHRSMVDKPTWVVDSPAYPLREGHISYDLRVGEYLETWPYVALEAVEEDATAAVVAESPASGGARRMTVSGVTRKGASK